MDIDPTSGPAPVAAPSNGSTPAPDEPSTAPDATVAAAAIAGLRGPNAIAGLRGPNAIAGLRGPNAIAGLRDRNAMAGLRDRNAMAGPSDPNATDTAPDLGPSVGARIRQLVTPKRVTLAVAGVGIGIWVVEEVSWRWWRARWRDQRGLTGALVRRIERL